LPSLALGTALVSGGFFIGIGFALVRLIRGKKTKAKGKNRKRPNLI
jgi:hypothetical protein